VPFDNVLVRQAFSRATDRLELKVASGFVGDPAERGGLIPPAMPGHSHRVGLPHDPELARALLAEAGFPDGRGLPELQLLARVPDAGESVARQWRDTLGARTRVIPVEEGGQPVAAEGNAVMDGWIADYPDPYNFLDHLRHGAAVALKQDERVDELLRQARLLHDRRGRIRLYEDVEQIWITEQAAILPLEYFRPSTLRRPWVEGYWLSPILGAPLDELNIRRPAASHS
jgi:ABC-type transport system substrate-binding protein